MTWFYHIISKIYRDLAIKMKSFFSTTNILAMRVAEFRSCGTGHDQKLLVRVSIEIYGSKPCIRYHSVNIGPSYIQ